MHQIAYYNSTTWFTVWTLDRTLSRMQVVFCVSKQLISYSVGAELSLLQLLYKLNFCYYTLLQFFFCVDYWHSRPWP